MPVAVVRDGADEVAAAPAEVEEGSYVVVSSNTQLSSSDELSSICVGAAQVNELVRARRATNFEALMVDMEIKD
jgi:hypothetical protein